MIKTLRRMRISRSIEKQTTDQGTEMNITKHARVLILGSGPAGYTAALYAARANLKPMLITGTTQGGQLATTAGVENWPADLIAIRGPELMDRFRQHAEQYGANIVVDQIHTVRLGVRPIRLTGDAGSYTCDALIIATGASARSLGLDSEQKFLGKGVSSDANCDGLFYRDKEVAVVGGGNTAVEAALSMSNVASKVTVIHRRDKFRAEPILVNRLTEQAKAGKVEIRWWHELDEVLGDEQGVNAIRVRDNRSGATADVPSRCVFVAVGQQPNTQLFAGKLKLANGYIVSRGGSIGMATMTSVPGVFAAGAVQDQVYRQAITSAAAGCMAALDAQRYLETQNRPAAGTTAAGGATAAVPAFFSLAGNPA
jgi:thioredoxin reductase (NADPH)